MLPAGPETPPTAAPEAAPVEGMKMGAEEPDTGGNLVSVLTEFFASIGKLKGSVWFGGDPLLAPEKFASDQWSVTVWVTDPLDQGTITRAAEKAEVVYGHIKFIQGAPSPEEETIQVAGGPPEEPPPVEGALPEPDLSGSPDLEAMLGGM